MITGISWGNGWGTKGEHISKNLFLIVYGVYVYRYVVAPYPNQPPCVFNVGRKQFAKIEREWTVSDFHPILK